MRVDHALHVRAALEDLGVDVDLADPPHALRIANDVPVQVDFDDALRLGEAEAPVYLWTPADKDPVFTWNPVAHVSGRSLDQAVLGQDAAGGRDFFPQLIFAGHFHPSRIRFSR